MSYPFGLNSSCHIPGNPVRGMSVFSAFAFVLQGFAEAPTTLGKIVMQLYVTSLFAPESRPGPKKAKSTVAPIL